MSELSKVVSYEMLVALSEDYDTVQTIAIDFICFQNKRLHDNRLTSLTEILNRHESLKAPAE